jgi:two-component system KDP operon response regulator KdpE
VTAPEGRNPRVLVIDDDATLAKALRLYFGKMGYQVFLASDGVEGLRQVFDARPDVIILDIMMPNMDGWELARRVREISEVPIVILTARKQENEVVRGLRLGADDYVSKPFSLKELEARVDAVLRRVDHPSEQIKDILYDDGYLVVDASKWEVMRDGAKVDLTSTELHLLLYLVENQGRVLTHRQLLEKVWGPEYVDEIDYVKLFIWRLRRKLEPEPGHPRYIGTERGVGYRFEMAQSHS